MTELFYLKQEPKTNSENQAPLLILLHGYGSHEEDLFSFKDEMPGSFRIVSFRAPYSIGFGGYAWYAINFDADQNKFSDLDQAKESLSLLKSNIEILQKQYGNTDENTFVLGFSQGCILSLALSINNPHLLSKVIGLSGYLNKDLIDDKQLNKASSLSIYHSHGTMDQVIPIDWARKSSLVLKEYISNYVFEEYPAGHTINPQNFFSFRAWLESHI